MLCAQCHKNEATIYFKQIINNQVTQLALCGDCAQKKGLVPAEADAFLFKLLSSLQGLAPAPRRTTPPKCPSCGLQLDEFAQTGRLGCPRCYDAFEGTLSKLLQQIHGATRHKGKHPGFPGMAAAVESSAGSQRPRSSQSAFAEIERLRRELQSAVAKEDFERAALLRDRIRNLQKQ